jgi:hypothetical protein
MQKSIFKILKIIIAALFLWFVIHSVYIITDGLSDQGKRADLAVILGNKEMKTGLYRQGLKNVWKPESRCISNTEFKKFS